ncbi:hypothetical protein WJX72_005748 [[Myrmecia] bisecta]|uniref:AAA+ ATPase domain-containing protein n=1 Tax=[Myrmecia] bisecta TaxID=41462 RepID=A0AAW1QF96_9CHLO
MSLALGRICPGMPLLNQSMLQQAWRAPPRQCRCYASAAGDTKARLQQEHRERDLQHKQQVSEVRTATLERMESTMKQITQSPKLPGIHRDDPSRTALAQRLECAIQAMQTDLVERDTEVRLLLLAALSGEHILFIGPPGTAKSELGRRLSRLYDGRFFERLLTRFSVPEELFGPLSMRALEEDRYVRQTDGYLPDASVAFIDEVFKANSAILNTLLTILNERLFDNGSDRVEVPLICLVGASNELPESEELDALYDRFLIRRKVGQVSSGGLMTLLSGASTSGSDSAADNGTGASASPAASAGPSISLSKEEFAHIRSTAMSTVKVPASIVDLLISLRTFLQEKCEPPVYVSDRRLKKAVQLMQVAAYTSGRQSVGKYDCLLMQHVLWQRPEESQRIGDWLLEQLASPQGLESIEYVFQGVFGRACHALLDEEKSKGVLKEVRNVKAALVERLHEIRGETSGDPAKPGNSLWVGREEAEAVASAMEPKLESTKLEAEALLMEMIALEVVLEKRVEAVLLADVLSRRWAAFIRNAPAEEVKPIGTRGFP